MNDLVPTERELWNTAKIYSISHVAEPLVKCRKLINICLFGVEEIGQEAGIPSSVINQNKILAIERLLHELIILVDTNINFMKKKEYVKLQGLRNRLTKIENVIDGVSYITTDQRNGESEVNLCKEHFNNCLRELREIYAKTIQNLADLIFPSGDDLDLEKIKQDIIEGG